MQFLLGMAAAFGIVLGLIDAIKEPMIGSLRTHAAEIREMRIREAGILSAATLEIRDFQRQRDGLCRDTMGRWVIASWQNHQAKIGQPTIWRCEP